MCQVQVKRPVGRPRLSQEYKRRVLVSFRVDYLEYVALKEEAAKERVKISALIRKRIGFIE